VPALSGRPLVLWDGDPRGQRALVLARFPAREAGTALRIGELWARRYGELALGEVLGPHEAPRVVAIWRNGGRIPL
jgi:hypothetical protein